ncbi:methyltransferase-like protein 6 [Rhinatrema bivittatum]|uniref:methyltransferase-like protein 6 n=1 Tax=Rhinatrema bivittatum TaxID=194408 RepID=UPI0011296DC4|nr:methyltransferase-like protein 6 [Rhinatrema bivittatum]XP_029445214.1 methyltransferase-like protein 6 [Rhinatrema bivittatum]XP_029445215.1 methyltransferase-like protein 6 [Rhinatrema bivittatum]XP_029445217.1 methyltransferase-like protein 6 [Rhinatrema bivittatum]
MQPEEYSINCLPRTPRLCGEVAETLLATNEIPSAVLAFPAALPQRRVPLARTLTAEEVARLEKDQTLVPDFKQLKLEKEAQKNWDLFYKRNSTNFFKDRHWTTREFEELRACREFENQKLTILEAGCGVGNCLFPLLEGDLNIFAYACDFSPRAVEFVKQNPLYNTERCTAFQCDLTKDDLLDNVPAESVDVVILIFVLSAIHPDKMHFAVENICKVLKPGGSILFRDYGLYDHTMLRFKSGNKLGENFYVRQDGTRSYFFTEEYLARLFTDVGCEQVVSDYVLRETVNKKEGLCVPRVFLQSKFRKPQESHVIDLTSDSGFIMK